MPLLTPEQFRATFGEESSAERPRKVDPGQPPPFDFWPYFDAIPAPDFEGHDCSAGRVEWVWRIPSGRFEHVLVGSEDPNVFLVLVLDLPAGAVYGHRLLDLNREYGLDAPSGSEENPPRHDGPL